MTRTTPESDDEITNPGVPSVKVSRENRDKKDSFSTSGIFEWRNPWIDFLKGNWSLTAPTAPGVYPVATRSGHQKGFITVHATFANGTQRLLAHVSDKERVEVTRAWSGWWWSQPVPALPAAPTTY